MQFDRILLDIAQKHGFPVAGLVDLELAETAFQVHVARYDDWIRAGMSAEMTYLVRGRDRRADPRLLMPDAQSMLCVGVPYSKKSQPFGSPRFARYLNGPDYHHEIAARLEGVLQEVAQIWNPAHPQQPLQWKICVDTSAVLERSWAALAGLGWIGKNTLLIHPQWGSFLFLGEVLLNQKTGVAPKLLPNYCGACTRCLNACPTQAFPTPHTLDSKRCVSYWTLEKRGDLLLSVSDRKAVGSWVAGCDLCQEVCPFNQKELKKLEAQTSRTVNPSEQRGFDLAGWLELISETPESYGHRIQNAALSRVKQKQFSRNVAIALSNAIRMKKQQSQSWDLDPVHEILGPLIHRRYQEEVDLVAKNEWQRCLESLSEGRILYS